MASDDTGSSTGGQAPAGWYPDPWYQGQQRYWDGRDWTAHSFPEEPGRAARQTATTPSAPPTTGVPGTGPPPPDWWAPATRSEPAPSTYLPPPPPPKRAFWPPRTRDIIIGAIVLAFLVGIIGGALLPRHNANTPIALPSNVPAPSPTAPGASPSPADPSASVLATLVLRQSDVTATEIVGTINGGDSVGGGATLDLCNGTYPSEDLRTARLQVAGVDFSGSEVLSTEAVLYQSPANVTQALSELQSVAAKCPGTPVVSPVGEPTITTHFNAAPDGAWPQVASVQRLAFDLVITDSTGSAQHYITVYLLRGRALLGVYFAQPDGPQAPVAGQNTVPGIVNVFAQRLAAVPASAIGG